MKKPEFDDTTFTLRPIGQLEEMERFAAEESCAELNEELRRNQVKLKLLNRDIEQRLERIRQRQEREASAAIDNHPPASSCSLITCRGLISSLFLIVLLFLFLEHWGLLIVISVACIIRRRLILRNLGGFLFAYVMIPLLLYLGFLGVKQLFIS